MISNRGLFYHVKLEKNIKDLDIYISVISRSFKIK